jgi:hypothetical protein
MRPPLPGGPIVLDIITVYELARALSMSHLDLVRPRKKEAALNLHVGQQRRGIRSKMGARLAHDRFVHASGKRRVTLRHLKGARLGR